MEIITTKATDPIAIALAAIRGLIATATVATATTATTLAAINGNYSL